MQILLYAVLYEKPIYSQASGLSDEIAIMKCIPIWKKYFLTSEQNECFASLSIEGAKYVVLKVF
jgi:hypothetical protein